jgi:hypothetical protein
LKFPTLVPEDGDRDGFAQDERLHCIRTPVNALDIAA